MADYRRFVSYMYEYEDGEKKKNVGYARVEIKNGECRFTIHMQIDGLQEGIFPTYLIHRPSDEMELIYLGDTSVKNQIMDSRLNAKEYNTMDSGYNFSDMGGILLFLNTAVFYATEWDDKPVVLNEVLLALKPKSKTKAPTEMANEVKEKSAPNMPSVDISTEPDKLGIKPIDDTSVLVRKPRDSKIEATKIEKSIKDEQQRPAYLLPGGGSMMVGNSPRSSKTPTNPWELVDRYKKSETKSKQIMEQEEIASPEAPTKEIASKAVKLDNSFVERVFTNYPRIYPFEDNEINRCVKVEPKDIGALPSDTWILSNNSFLLHGYYCYHHLIFAEITKNDVCHYILGVPGIYHKREQFMARMFGFECFKSIRRRELRQGDFGYWYLEVNF